MDLKTANLIEVFVDTIDTNNAQEISVMMCLKQYLREYELDKMANMYESYRSQYGWPSLANLKPVIRKINTTRWLKAQDSYKNIESRLAEIH
jgi:hypothetical protein